MNADLSIRAARPADLDDAARLFDAYRQFYGQPTDRAAGRAFLAERMALRESIVLLAWRGNLAVGFTQLYPMFSSVRLVPVFVLNDLYVDSGARRMAVGRRLLEAAAAAARAAGGHRIVLETAVENLAARALYRNAGWDEEATQWYSLDLAGSRVRA
ncbi:GNAT family N-acetyltransferase [Cognatilysobacter lacus]|uniref:GNAT family N-acetyltransferase n=1 Tax=Cognatilysobacter lacus TaxID=1643323 RepID=A0A5D8YND6_9GAMM|nr:GNAT family N-acetyltransferase [Lysobacter lacus]TZF83353.1 GNAT family N-acetyltransferase [Lysobacter lacus]